MNKTRALPWGEGQGCCLRCKRELEPPQGVCLVPPGCQALVGWLAGWRGGLSKSWSPFLTHPPVSRALRTGPAWWVRREQEVWRGSPQSQSPEN